MLRSHIIQLTTQLQSTRKGNQSITEYAQKIKHISDTLAAISSPVDEEDLIIHTLNGLPQEFGPFKTSICTRSSSISLEEFQALLLCEELNLEQSNDIASDFSTTALQSSKDNQGRGSAFNNN